MLASPSRRFVVTVAVVTVLGLALRLAYVWFVRRDLTFGGDPFYYHIGANLLADGKGFINPYAYALHQNVQGADHPPLYIVYLSLASLVGVRSITGHLIASAVLGAASIPVAAMAGRRIAGGRVGVVAAVLVAVYPNVWRWDGMLLSETLVIFLVLLAVWFAYRYLAAPSWSRLWWLGVVTGLCALSRSELLLLGPLLLVPLALGTRSQSVASRWRWLAVSGAGCLLVVGPWVGFNLARFDHPVLFTDNLGGTLAVANCDSAYYGANTGYWDYFCGVQALERHGIAPDQFGGPADRSFRQDAIDYASAHRARIPAVVAARVGRVVGLFRPAQQAHLDIYLENTTDWVVNAGLVTYYLVALAAVAGAVVLRRRRVPVYPLLVPVATVVITAAAFYGATRFRASAEPVLCLLAAVALVALVERLGDGVAGRSGTGWSRPTLSRAPSSASGGSGPGGPAPAAGASTS